MSTSKVNRKSSPKSPLQWVGLLLFGISLVVFTAMLGVERYTATAEDLPEGSNEYQAAAIAEAAQAAGFVDREYGNAFAFVGAYEGVFAEAQSRLEREFEANGAPDDLDEWSYKMGDGYLKGQLAPLVLSASDGPVSRNPWLWIALTFGLAILGGLLYILPKFSAEPGIKHDHIYHSALTRGLNLGWRTLVVAGATLGILGYGVLYMGGNYFWPGVTALVAGVIAALVFFAQRSIKHDPPRDAGPDLASAWLGIFAGVYFIGFYVLLYWAAQYVTPWVIMVNPISEALSGNMASQWFLYGLMYCAIVVVMGVRMWAKYQHNRYQLIRTGSVMFFQVGFAFLIPELLVRFNKPWYDFKNIWPLDYDFFFQWNIKELLANGSFGVFVLGWGIALVVVAVPLMTYFFGKRWYCSWVCGCGGLAETMGDPYRQLSDKSLRAWKFERFIIHGVLVFAVVMTGLTLYNYFSGEATVLGLNGDNVRQWYGFLIGAGFAGVVGTGFYPLMGNRVWCRFGCPLAAYLGLVQRFQSRFRITTNGGQCISCGNCSTYCEMGIDVRWYAQRGQDIVRSSCVGCGVCSAVCPRGVLRLENGDDTSQYRADDQRVIHIAEGAVGVL